MAETPEPNQPEPEARKIKVAQNATSPDEIFVDGVSGILARPGVVKLDCYRVLRIDREDNAEVRTMTHRLVMPAGSMRELAKLLQNWADQARRAQEEAEAGKASIN